MRKFLSVVVVLVISLSVAGCSSVNEEIHDNVITGEIEYEAAKVSYLGPEGTYTQEACEVFFDKQGEYSPYETVDEAVSALVDGETDFAVIPQENTIGGAVIDYVDILVDTEEVSVVGEVELPISQNLLVLPTASLKDIKTIYSHKQGIAQGKDWIEKNIPDAEIVEVSSTAEGAKVVSESNDLTKAAIASLGCADVYGLKILEKGIQNNKNNVTRFYVLSLEDAETYDSDRMAFIASGSAEMLPSLMKSIEKQGISLVSIHDRPKKTKLGEYYYLIECEDMKYQEYEKMVKSTSFDFRYLGSFSCR